MTLKDLICFCGFCGFVGFVGLVVLWFYKWFCGFVADDVRAENDDCVGSSAILYFDSRFSFST